MPTPWRPAGAQTHVEQHKHMSTAQPDPAVPSGCTPLGGIGCKGQRTTIHLQPQSLRPQGWEPSFLFKTWCWGCKISSRAKQSCGTCVCVSQEWRVGHSLHKISKLSADNCPVPLFSISPPALPHPISPPLEASASSLIKHYNKPLIS